MKYTKFMFAVVSLLVVFGILAGCGGQATQAPAEPQATEAKTLKVGLLLPGPAQDKGWNQLAYDSLMAIEKELGAEVSYVELEESPSAFEKAFTDYASQGYNLIIGHGYQFQDAMEKVAPQFPDSVFVTSGGEKFGANYGPIYMAHEENMYLLGVIAAGMSKSGKAVGIGGMEIPAIITPYEGFKAGFEDNGGESFTTTYINSWDDIGAAKEAAVAAFNSGADVILPNANIAGLGVFQAAQEQGFWTFGTNSDQSAEAPDQVLANTVLNYQQAFINIAKSVMDGTYKGGQPLWFGLADPDVISITYNPKTEGQIPQEVKDKVEEARQKIVSGELVVPGSYRPKP